MTEAVEAKIVVLGAQGVGKTSLVHRYVKHSFIPPSKAQTTVGASFLTARVNDAESGTTLRFQIWDTAGQERFRSISKLYYRGASAAILCYDVTSAKSFEEMGHWLQEMKTNGLADTIVHIVGTKADIVAADPRKREVPFEQCIGYVAEQLYPEAVTPGAARQSSSTATRASSAHGLSNSVASPISNRSSGFWGTAPSWNCCHEVSAKDGEGIDEVFRVITRKLVEQHAKRTEVLNDQQLRGQTPGITGQQGYFDLPNGNGSFRLGHGDKRRSWLGLTTPGGLTSYGDGDEGDARVEGGGSIGRGRCC